MRRIAFLTVLVTAVVGVWAGPAAADGVVDSTVCLAGATGTLTLNTPEVLWADTARLTVTANLPAACAGATLTLRFNGVSSRVVPPITLPVVPPVSGPYTLMLTTGLGVTEQLASAAVTVDAYTAPALPPGSDITVVSNAPAQRRLFVQAVQSPGVTVRVSPGVNLDLSGVKELRVPAGVRLLGSYPARVYTTTFPDQLFTVVGGNVLIQGLRIDGGEPANPFASAGTDDAAGITVLRTSPDADIANVDIGFDELYGWRGQAIGAAGITRQDNLRVHDNYIHDNQHPTGGGPYDHGAGYGVVVYQDSVVTVERNVFDRNRHAVSGSGDGTANSGYVLNDNLFLRAGVDPGGPSQVIDMHGHDYVCPQGHWNCGQAGSRMDLHANTITNTDGPSISLRGTPSDGMYLDGNVFALDQATVINQPFLTDKTKLRVTGNNVFGSSAFKQTRTECDFDGDGINDAFMATGATWWYTSSTHGGRWVYTGESTVPLSAVTLTQVGSRCVPSLGPVVPSIIGMTRTAASAALGLVGLSLGLEHDVTAQDCDDTVNTITGQAIPAGTTVAQGTSVNFDFTLPPKKCP